MNALHKRLSRLRAHWQGGLAWSGLLAVIGALLMAVLIYGSLDYFLAFGERVRMIAGVSLLGLAAAWLVVKLTTVWTRTNKDMARRADELLGNRRQPVLTALELSQGRNEGQGELEQFLIDESVAEAGKELAKVGFNAAFPRREFKLRMRNFAMQLLVIAVALAFFWPAASVILPRLAMPWRDLPPFSQFEFRIEPNTPTVFYGEDADLMVEILGQPINSQVWFMTRDANGNSFETACFQEGPNRFAQRLEKVVQPVEFSFRVGSARSKWHAIDLQLQPKIALASVAAIPPTYTNLPERTFLLGAEPLEGLRGTKLRLSVTSNRPLAGGRLQIAEAGKSGKVMGVEGEKTGPRTVSFRLGSGCGGNG